MKRERKGAPGVQGSEQNGRCAGLSIRDHSDCGQTAHCQSRHGGQKHVAPFEGTEWERREKRYIAKALAGVSRGTSVLYWPCGRGQLLPLLKRLDCSVTCVDSSPRAVAQARFYGGFLGESCIDDTDDFLFVDILQAGFDDDHFGGAIVNHLLCYSPESQMRQQILKEFGRICSGPIVVSFLCIAEAEKHVCHEHDGRRKHPIRDKVFVNRRSFAEEVRECGLTVDKWVPKHSLISKQACAVLVRDKGVIRPSHLP